MNERSVEARIEAEDCIEGVEAMSSAAEASVERVRRLEIMTLLREQMLFCWENCIVADV